MDRHFKMLGYLFIIYGVWGLVNILLVVLTRGIGTTKTAIPPGQATVAIVVSVVFLVLFGIAGWALLTRKDWGRSIAIGASIIALISFPIGTALGIYGLWAMFSESGRREYPRYAGSIPPEHPAPG